MKWRIVNCAALAVKDNTTTDTAVIILNMVYSLNHQWRMAAQICSVPLVIKSVYSETALCLDTAPPGRRNLAFCDWA